MRFLLLLPLASLLACTDGSSDTDTDNDTDAVGETDDTTGETDDGVPADTDPADTDGDDFPDPGADFAAEGPGAGYHWFLEPAPTDAPYTNCNVGGPNSMNFYADTWQLQSPSASLMQFAIAFQATPGGTLTCDYELDGTFTCSTAVSTTNMAVLPPPYDLDAVVTMSTTASGRFRARTADDPSTDEDHLYAARWAADLDLTFSVTCTGSECGSAAAGMGAASFPCTSTFTDLASVNYADPTLSVPMP